VDTFKVIDRGVTYHIEEVEEGGYFGQVVAVPACITEGLTLDETVANLREALDLYLEVAEEDGIDVPDEIRAARTVAS
jgi:predicted RNase H-like HicB family nuclease